MKRSTLSLAGLCCLLLAAPAPSLAKTPFWGAKASSSIDVPPEALADGQFVWDPQAAPSGPIVVVVSLDDQVVRVYRNGIAIGWAKVSTGKAGHRTPTGVFVTLQKDKDHHSSIYNNAPMPYTQRLTWGGISLHAGSLPGYPVSHGCVHLPSLFAEKLFEVSPLGMTVVVSSEHDAPKSVAHPGLFSPVDPKTGEAWAAKGLAPTEAFRLEPDKAPDGPIAVIVSSPDRRLVIFRNGVEIGEARIQVPADMKFGSHVYLLQERGADGLKWHAVGVPGHAEEDHRPLDPQLMARIGIPGAFQDALTGLLHSGATMMVTDEPLHPHATGVEMTVIANGPAVETAAKAKQQDG